MLGNTGAAIGFILARCMDKTIEWTDERYTHPHCSERKRHEYEGVGKCPVNWIRQGGRAQSQWSTADQCPRIKPPEILQPIPSLLPNRFSSSCGSDSLIAFSLIMNSSALVRVGECFLCEDVMLRAILIVTHPHGYSDPSE